MYATKEIRFNSYNTRRNLPAGIRRKRGEANFLGAFIRSLLQEIDCPCFYGRNFPVPGCGVSDLVLCNLPEQSESEVNGDGMFMRAFEMKLSDWKKALQQAYRYKYYADLSIVVLPEKSAFAAIQSGELFEALGVGLWTYDALGGNIRQPIPAKSAKGPLNKDKRSCALTKLRSRIGDFCMLQK